MRPRSASKANRSKSLLHVTSMGVFTDAPVGRRSALSRRVRKKREWRFLSARLTKRNRKQIKKAILSFAMLLAFSLFSICFGDAVFAPDAREDSWIEESALASETLFPAATRTDVFQSAPVEVLSAANPDQTIVYYSKSGSRYHLIATCSGMKEAMEASQAGAKALGLTPCKRCNPPE